MASKHQRLPIEAEIEPKWQCTICMKLFTYDILEEFHFCFYTGHVDIKADLKEKEKRIAEHYAKLMDKLNRRSTPCSSVALQKEEDKPNITPLPPSITKTRRETKNERVHVCGTCGRAFSRANALKHHMYIHTGEKPYKCQDCHKGFRQPGDLKKHRSRVHESA